MTTYYVTTPQFTVLALADPDFRGNLSHLEPSAEHDITPLEELPDGRVNCLARVRIIGHESRTRMMVRVEPRVLEICPTVPHFRKAMAHG